MPGFTKENRPVRPGAYFNWEAEPVTTVAPNIGSVVCVPIVHDWGPAGVLTPCLSFGDFQVKFGPSTTTPGYIAINQCFKGEGVGGRGGAGEILVYRMVTDAAAEATITINDETDTGAITLTAVYKGSYGNNLGVRVRTSSASADSTQVLITLSGTVIETHAASSLAGAQAMVDAINSKSTWVTAELVGTPTAALATPDEIVAFAGGDDGAELQAEQWMDMLDQVSNARFSLFAPYDMTDLGILGSLQAWCANLNANSKRFMMVVGGGPADTADTAIDRSTMLSGLPDGEGGGENIVNLGVGTLVDAELGTLSTSQLAPRIAGVLAARGETMSLTFARMQGTSPGVMPSDSDISLCFDGGVVVFGQDSNADSPIRVEKGLTTYTGGDDTKPYLIYRNPKFVRTMHGIELDITDWATSSAIGLLEVNDQTRALVVGYGHQVMDARAGLGVIQDGYTVAIDPTPPPSDDDEFVAVVYGIAFGRSVEQIYNTVYIT